MTESRQSQTAPTLAMVNGEIRSGRYRDALRGMQALGKDASHLGIGHNITMAELRLRLGESERAAQDAGRLLSSPSLPSNIVARCHILLGTWCRDGGRLSQAIQHFHRAITAAVEAGDRDAAAWAHLRLMLTVAEDSGPQAAVALLAEVRKRVVQLGDSQALAALHFFLAEIETKRGLPETVHRHLRIGRSLLEGEYNV